MASNSINQGSEINEPFSKTGETSITLISKIHALLEVAMSCNLQDHSASVLHDYMSAMSDLLEKLFVVSKLD